MSEDLLPLLTSRETAKALHLSEITIRRAWLDGRLPGVRIGRSIRYRREDLDRIRREGLPAPVKAVAAEER